MQARQHMLKHELGAEGGFREQIAKQNTSLPHTQAFEFQLRAVGKDMRRILNLFKF